MAVVTFGILLILFIHNGIAFPPQTVLVSNACYGTNPSCDFYTMRCNSGEMIRLGNLYAGYDNGTICQSTLHCVAASTCCAFSQGNEQELFNKETTYSIYTNCSSLQACSNQQAPWQAMSTDLYGTRTFSSYVHLEYTCTPEYDVIHFCGGLNKSSTIVTDSIEIIFDGSLNIHGENDTNSSCQCSLISALADTAINITINTLDVRLESRRRVDNQTAAACSSASITSNVLNVTCTDSDTRHLDNFLYNNGEVIVKELGANEAMQITLDRLWEMGAWDLPLMIRLDITGQSAFKMTCGMVFPDKITTVKETSATTEGTSTTTGDITTAATVSPTATVTGKANTTEATTRISISQELTYYDNPTTSTTSNETGTTISFTTPTKIASSTLKSSLPTRETQTEPLNTGTTPTHSNNSETSSALSTTTSVNHFETTTATVSTHTLSINQTTTNRVETNEPSTATMTPKQTTTTLSSSTLDVTTANDSSTATNTTSPLTTTESQRTLTSSSQTTEQNQQNGIAKSNDSSTLESDGRSTYIAVFVPIGLLLLFLVLVLAILYKRYRSKSYAVAEPKKRKSYENINGAFIPETCENVKYEEYV